MKIQFEIPTTKVLQSQMTNEKVECTLINDQTITQPTAIVDVVTPFYEGSIEVLVFTNCVADLILGNDIDPNAHIKIQSLRNDKHDDNSYSDSYLKHITARSQTAKTKEKDKSTIKNSEEKTTSKTNSTNKDDDNKSKSHSNNQEKSHIFGRFSKEAFKQAQEQDKSLSKLKYLASAMSGYAYEDELLIRRFENKIDNQTSIIVPSCLRMEVLELAHDSVFAGHLGIAATKKSLLNRFKWPGVTKDIANYVKSCEICQKHAKKKPKTPLGKMEVITKPFEKVAIDIVGILPETNKGNSYILTLVDFFTRWPEDGH